ncbi:MAG: alpha-1,2-fucosyltransferase [Lachnospiraceae bacterium]|nr:alpha-1,2-fucosyltransferase [Lachnospiraceae bacterium]
MESKLFVFGAGAWGEMAYHYYKDKCLIAGFLDNSSDMWGKSINGIQIYNPKILGKMNLDNIRIVIANKWRGKEIFKQLHDQFGISQCIFFSVQTTVEEYTVSNEEGVGDECIVKYIGGLGNQMFQYALAKCLMSDGVHVTGDLSGYYAEEDRNFALQDTFPRVMIEKCNGTLRKQYKEGKGSYILELRDILVSDEKPADLDVLKLKRGYMEGYWQTSKYVELAEKELRREFQFAHKEDQKLNQIVEEATAMENTVSIHIRRGDYLAEHIQRSFGNICTDDYYLKAIHYIQRNIESPVFYFFSNDIEWVKERYEKYNATYISEEMFDDYEDWYDMYLMSRCKHNIIANSTFSWWGAWLNQNSQKIVIAPKKWMNIPYYTDICPKTWIRI